LTNAVGAVGAGYAVLLIVVTTQLPLGVIPFTMMVGDVGLKIAAVEASAKIRLVDLLVAAMGAYQAVGARLRLVVGVLLPYALSLGCCNVEVSTSFCDLGGLRKTLEYLEYSGHVCRWRGEDMMVVVVQDKLTFKVPRLWWRSTPSPNLGVAALGVLEIFFILADDLLVGLTNGTKRIAVKMFFPMLVVLTVEGLGVQRDDRDLGPAIGAVAVGREGEDRNLIFGLSG
jgi:hypothetical protein